MFQPQPIYFAASDLPYATQPPSNNLYSSYDQISPPSQHHLRSRGPTSFTAPNFSAAPTGLWGNFGGQPQQQQQRILPSRPAQRQQGHQYYNTNNLPNIRTKMEVDPGDYEAQQALANGYAPALEGPPVGERKSSHAITEEYAKADPVYVEKTRRLPQTYSHYRPVLGDGNCGWRAIGFSYFECLISLWSTQIVDAELARLQHLTKDGPPGSATIPTLGIMPEDYVEEFFEPLLALFSDLSSLISSGTSAPEHATRMLVDRYNDPEAAQSLTYIMRPIAAAQLLANEENYRPFLAQGMSIESEKGEWMQISTEIDYLGMTVLIDALMKPARFITEIVILERSEGNEVNTIRYDQDVSGEQMPADAPTAYILYKPGHYDILYKGNNQQHIQRQVQNAMNAAQNVQVNRAAMPTRQLDPSPVQTMSYGGSMDMGLLSAIPGLSMGGFSGFQPQYGTPMSSSFAPTPSSFAASPSAFTPSSSSFAPTPSSFAASPYGNGLDTSMSMSTSFSAPIKSISPSPMSVSSTLASIPPNPSQSARTPPSNFSPNKFPPSQFSGSGLTSRPATRNNSIATDSSLLSPGGMTPTTPLIVQQLSSLGVNSNDQFRQSRYVFERPADSNNLRGGGLGGGGLSGWGGGGRGEGEMQTRQFRESHHNEAHYDNKNFQPYMWNPGEEEEDGNGGGRKMKGRRRGS